MESTKNEISSKKILDRIRSKYILKAIFDNLKQNKFLEMIRYNKEIRSKLDISINDFKECLQIEIEIIPILNKNTNFIYISNKNNKGYYHIYLDNNQKEIKRVNIKAKDNAKKITVKIDYEIKFLSELFKDCKNIEKINVIKWNRKDINDLNSLCYNCKSLKEVNFSNINTNNVINMSRMFYKCSSLEELNISSFNTNNVTDMSYMFYECSSLNKLNISNINTSNVNNISGMFYGCSSLKELDVSKFNTHKVTDMSNMFYKCSSIKK